MQNKLPNFLIAGATKCGSSSLNKYLEQHPDIFMSKQKEPRFLSSQVMRFPIGGPFDDKVESWYVKDFKAYQNLFQNAKNEKIIGEASVDTIYFHQDVVPIIKQYLGDPKILIVLRDPVQRAFSAYQHLVRDGRETLPFEEALSMEKYRIAENYELIYHYTQAALYSEQLKTFIDNFTNVKVILIEEFNQDKDKMFRQIFEFLDIDPNVKINTDINYNASGVPKNRFLHNLIREKNVVKTLLKPITFFMSQKMKDKILNHMAKKNMSRMRISFANENMLQKYFKPEIKKLEKLLDKRLDIWLKNY